MAKDFRSTKRRWIKLYPVESLQGSIRYQLTSAERGVWYDLLCFSSLCSNTGDISDRDGHPFPLSYIANRLNVQMSLLKGTLDKCVAEGRLTQDDNGFHITNWVRYQSEYDRQKPYRPKKSLDELNQENLAKHPEKALASAEMESYNTEEVYEGDEEELARGNESLEEHEEALVEQNPNVREHKERLEKQQED